MSNKPQSRGNAAVTAAASAIAAASVTTDGAAAAAAFADGHVGPVAPVAQTITQAALETVADPLEAIRQAEHVGMTRDVLDGAMSEREEPMLGIADEPTGFILIVCAAPGFRRGGFSHPARAEYPLDSFTQEQIDAFVTEPRLEMITVGGGQPIPRFKRKFGAEAFLRTAPLDPLLAGRAAEAAISRPPNRAEPGLRNAAASRAPSGFSGR